MPHSPFSLGAQPLVDNQPPQNTQGQFGQGPDRPFQLGQRDVGEGPILGTLLQQLLGQEGEPALPQNRQVPGGVLKQQRDLARGNDDPVRLRAIQEMIRERLLSSDSEFGADSDVGPQGPLTTAEPDKKRSAIDPFDQREFDDLLRQQ